MTDNVLFFDIETTPEPQQTPLWEKLYNEKQQRIFSDLKEYGFTTARHFPEMSLHPAFCRIRAIAFTMGHAKRIDEIDTLIVGRYDTPEQQNNKEYEILKKFWKIIEPYNIKLCGFNILGFDLPVIFTRSRILGITPTRVIDRRPWGKDCIDLYKEIQYTTLSGGLKPILQSLGLDEGLVMDSGKNVIDMTDDEVCKYVRSDVEGTRRLYTFMKGFWF